MISPVLNHQTNSRAAAGKRSEHRGHLPGRRHADLLGQRMLLAAGIRNSRTKRRAPPRPSAPSRLQHATDPALPCAAAIAAG